MGQIDFNDLLKSYNFTCAKCGFEQNARPSLMMKSFHENSGMGSCLECGQFLALKISADGTRMKSMIWDEYLKEKGIVKENA